MYWVTAVFPSPAFPYNMMFSGSRPNRTSRSAYRYSSISSSRSRIYSGW